MTLGYPYIDLLTRLHNFDLYSVVVLSNSNEVPTKAKHAGSLEHQYDKEDDRQVFACHVLNWAEDILSGCIRPYLNHEIFTLDRHFSNPT